MSQLHSWFGPSGLRRGTVRGACARRNGRHGYGARRRVRSMASALAMQAKPLSLPTEQSRRRSGLRPGDSEHLHPALGAEHPLPIGGQDQGLIAGHVVRLSRDVPRAIEEEHPQKLTGSSEEMH